MDTCINGRVGAVTSINLWREENFVKLNKKKFCYQTLLLKLMPSTLNESALQYF